MKVKKLLLATALFFGIYSVSAQITITSNDMPNVSDNILISVNTSLANFNPSLTGANYTWDYSKLVPDSQRYVNFVSAISTPYTLFLFLSSYGTRNYTPDAIPWSILGTPPTNVYDFYKKTGAAYTMVGEGLTEAGAAIPGIYSVADQIYAFPINYLNKDSSNSAFAFPIPNQGYYAKKQKRVNHVDGWGTLITPYGTFNTIRVKSILTITDSIYIDTVHFGFKIPRPIAYEYKWFGTGSKIPLLEIDVTAAGGNNVTVTRANWQDSAMTVPSVSFTQQNTCPIVNEGSLTANVTGGRYPLTYLWSNGKTTRTISNLAPGNYDVTVTDKYGKQVTATGTVDPIQNLSCLNIPNAFTPDGDGVNDVWNIRSLTEFTSCKVEIFNPWGSLVFKSTGYGTPWDGKYNGEPVPAGAYYYIIDLNNNSNKYTGTVTIVK
jgi:gliding motility-associated-like protein